MRVMRGDEAWKYVASLETRDIESWLFRQAVEPVIRDVRIRGDTAIAEHLVKAYGVEITPEDFRVSRWEIEDATSKLSPQNRRLIEESIEVIEDFHRGQMPQTYSKSYPWGEAWISWEPLDRVGVHVPEYDEVAYVSTLLFAAVPAKVAGVREVAVFTPPLGGGRIHPVLLAACGILGIEEVYRIGGPVAVAAMAYGTSKIPAVEKIFGSGDSYFMAAKQIVASDVPVDMPSGPSETVVLADSSADPRVVAAEMVAQAEHDVDSMVLLLTDDEGLVEEVLNIIEEMASSLDRGGVAREALNGRGAVLVFENLDEVVEAVNVIAPERVTVLSFKDSSLASEIKKAGAVFVGPYTVSAFGDYALGINQLLPSGGHARRFGALTVHSFLRPVAHGRVSPDGAKELADLVAGLARLEGLTAHAEAVRIATSSPSARS
ncbi:MAG: histidinol dehydrogenase [Candidatus Korarchaeota archaeon]|nr:histidinol dehydrogenase [Candidatus Korarchaeota archaeon]